MRRSTKLTILILALILIFSLIGFAIFAVLKGPIGIGGDINIRGYDLNVKIEGKMYGHSEEHKTSDIAEILPGEEWDGNPVDGEEEYFLNWNNLDLTFIDKHTPIVIEVAITNRNEDHAVAVDFESKINTEKYNYSITIESSGTAEENIVEYQETAVYKITFNVINRDRGAKGAFKINFSLESI